MAWTVRSRWGPPRQLRITRIGWFYVLLTLGMGLAGINTGNNLVMLTCGVMLGLIIASGILSERCLRELDVLREFPGQLAAGAESLVVLRVSNPKRYASFGVQVQEVDGAGQAYFPIIAAGQTERRAYRLTPSKRGTLHSGDLRLATAFPFGLFEKSLVLRRPHDAPVGPDFAPAPPPTELPRDGIGDRGAAGEGSGPDPWELKLHRAGEDVRRIAWAQSARAGHLLALTREQEGVAEARLVIRAQSTPDAREHHLAQLRTQAEDMLRQGLSVSLSAGPNGETVVVPAGAGEAQRARILRALAREPGGQSSAPLGREIEDRRGSTASTGVPRFLKVQQAALLAVVAVAFGSLVASRELPMAAIISFALILAYAVPMRERATVGFGWAVNLLSLAGLFTLAGLTAARIQTVPLAAAELVLLLCANRLLVRRVPLDDALLHLTAFLVLAAGAALGNELEYGFTLALFCILTPPSLLLSELRRGVEQGAPAQASALMTSPDLTAPRLLSFAAALGTFALAFGVILFPLFPRAQLGLLQALSSDGPRQSGVSANVDLSAGGPFHGSSRIVLRVEITSGDPELLHYFRAVTLDRFSGSGWAPAKRRIGPGPEQASAQKALVSGELAPLLSIGDFLPVPEGLSDLRAETSGLGVRSDDEGDLQLRSVPSGELAFHFDSVRERQRSMAREPEDDLALPDLPAAVAPLAAELIPDGLSAGEALRRVQRHLTRFHYDRDVPGGPQAFATFFETRTGDCQLFATAAVVLLRSRGIPARYVAGYYLDSPHIGENLIRSWDAHAWAEVLTPEGPMLLDATPSSERGGPRDRRSLWQSAADLWQAAQFRWLRSVVDYDQQSQLAQATRLISLGRRLWRGTGGNPLTGRFVLLGLGLLVALAVFRRGWSSRDPARRLEERLFARLLRLGVTREPGTTYEEALTALRNTRPDVASRVASLLQRLGRARFGGQPLDLDERVALSRAIDRIA